MPKNEIDYSNTIFYKIYCVNPDITEMYIGHTTNFVQRKHGHKQGSTNTKCQSYNCKLYNFIRNHGGWNNWIMEIIAFHNCKDHYSARIQEQTYFKEYNATLNSIEPFPSPKIKITKEKIKKEVLHCNTCNVAFTTTKLQDLHNKTNKHIKRLNLGQMTNIQSPKMRRNFICKQCDFICYKQSEYNRHILTRKHEILINPNNKTPKNAKSYMCSCGKVYKHASSLCGHKKKCKYLEEEVEEEEEEEEEEIPDYKELLLEAMKQLQKKDELVSEAMAQMADQQKQITEMIPLIGNNNNNTNNNTTNKFNLNIFLNETCKDALNINDFIDSLQLQLNDLDKMNELGYVNGLTRIFLNGLNQLDLTKRPLHCSDAKREILYVKENDEWEKEESKTKLNSAISIVGRKTLKHFPEWMEKHPNCNDNNSKENEEYHTLIKNTITQNTEDNKNKVAKNIIKDVVIDK